VDTKDASLWVVNGLTVRAYEANDRSQVRHICFVTGYMGDPVDWQWRDEESFAEVFSGYYTDREPESASVGELDGEVVGYLLGSVDTRQGWNPATVMARQVLTRGIAFRPGTAAFLWRSAGDVVVDLSRRRLPPARVLDPRWPAHLHINLLPAARGKGLGAALVQRWLARLRATGVPGCHLETLAENTPAIAFFEAMGFCRLGEPVRAPGLRSPSGGRHHLQVMVQPLERDGSQ
jgi:ribosomal protein S18 acetylase RimI-like enzyme